MMRPVRLLLVDDDPDAEALVKRILEKDFPQLHVTTAPTPEAFSSALEQGNFDLVITDFQLPWTDGIRVLQAVKGRYPHCPVIMFTATGSEEVAVEAMKAGLDDYVLKTVRHLNRLSAAVKAVLERAEERARAKEMEERYRQLFTRLPVGVFRARVDGRWEETNPAFREILRAPSTEALERIPFWHLFAHAADREVAFRQLMETGALSLHRVEGRRLDGSTFWAQIEATLTLADDAHRIDGVLIDVTPTVVAEMEREQLTTILRTLVEHLPEGIVLLDASWRVVMSNAKGREILFQLGYREGLPLAMLGGHPISEFFQSSLRGARQDLCVNNRTYEVAFYPLPDNQWILVLRDVTVEREIRRRAQIQERLAAIGELAAGLVHDFNNFLSSIVGNAELMAMRPDMPSEVREFAKTLIVQGERSAALIRKILDFSRRTVSEQSIVELGSFLQECLQFLSRLLPETIRLELDISPGSHYVRADVAQMQQVIANLLVNARDAMPEGGELRIGLRRVVLCEDSQPPFPSMAPGEWELITVSDTGIGIAPEHLPHIFEPFFTTKSDGTGLGLAQVYGIVVQHGGFIDVQSELGRGTTFFIYLPAVTGAVEEPAKAAQPEVPSGEGELILLTEDEEGVRLVVHRMLERLNYRVLAARDGIEALQLYERYKDDIALVLTDLVMPEMSGDRLISELRRRNPKVKVVLMTGYLLSEEQQILRIPNIVGWLQKPPRLSALARAIKTALGAEPLSSQDERPSVSK